MWTPTRPDIGEGSTDREEPGAGERHSPTNEHLIRSTGVFGIQAQKDGLQPNHASSDRKSEEKLEK